MGPFRVPPGDAFGLFGREVPTGHALLAFPEHPASIVVFGLGYGLEQLAEVEWLRELAVCYWDDVDTHGFGILNRLRANLPHAKFFLMDRETLCAHRALYGQPSHSPDAPRRLFFSTHWWYDSHE